MTCFLCINAVLVVFVGTGFVTCIMAELNEWETAAVAYLSREHEADFVGSHFGIEVDDTLNILNRITVAVAVSESAVNE